jgi:transcriptional regulator with XRE-family HTH domain
MNIGEVIKRIKFESDLNQQEIGEILGCTQVSISRIRRNLQVPNAALLLKIVKLAKKYNIKVEMEDLISND